MEQCNLSVKPYFKDGDPVNFNRVSRSKSTPYAETIQEIWLLSVNINLSILIIL